MSNFPSIQEQEKWISLALQYAKEGIGNVAPNPLVGAVVVKNGVEVGHGAHLIFGGDHAEVNALRQAKDQCEGADLYVTLEPCSHHGKTPPCADLIIEKRIKRVFIGMIDCNPRVRGKGIQRLQSAGIEVKTGILTQQCEALNQPFIKRIQTEQSFVFLKAAITLDGKIATATGDSKWISNEIARKRVDYYRLCYSAVLCGAGTLKKDNPSLSIRSAEYQKGKNPYRLFLCRTLKGIDPDCTAIQKAKDSKTILFAPQTVKEESQYAEFIDRGVQFELFQENPVPLKELLKRTAKRGIDSILVEGGGQIITQFLKEKRVDQGEIFIAPIILGDSKAIPICNSFSPQKISEGIRLKNVKTGIYGDNCSFSFTNHFYTSEVTPCLPD